MSTEGKVVVITGPTASGKTSAAINLALEIGGEVISADSMQVYKYMDIGTAKPSREEMLRVRHHMIGIIDPLTDFSVADYQKLAVECIDKILKKGGTPVIAGGTGLYLKSVTDNIAFSDAIRDNGFREEMNQLAVQKGNTYLHSLLSAINPEAAAAIHPNNLKRVIRALEMNRQPESSNTSQIKLPGNEKSKYGFIIFCLNPDRKVLYQRINERVEKMVAEGLENEVRKLVDMGVGSYNTAMQGIGYKEMAAYLDKRVTLEEAIIEIGKRSRNYAKRQLTWFRKMNGAIWLNNTEKYSSEQITNIMLQRIKF